MRYAILSVVSFFLIGSVTGHAQSRAGQFYSVGGFGSVLYPGTGHAPGTPPSAAQFGSFRGRPFNGRPFGGGQVNHGGHGATVIVPYPIYYGGYGGYGYDSGAPLPDQGGPPPVNTNAAPSVVINQNFAPERSAPLVREYGPAPSDDQSSGLKLYQAPPSHPYADAQEQAAGRAAARNNDDEPTIYLIAFKDHSVVQALGYWMEGNTLHYVSAEHSLNQASVDLIDRALSQRLNDERGVEFKLPNR